VSDLPQRAQLEDVPGTVLLLIDDADEREASIAWLEEAGYRVIVAQALDEALTLAARRRDLDVVVADVRHAGDGPRSILDAARGDGPEVILCGQTDTMTVVTSLARGAVSFLPHPLNQADLLLQVLRAVGAARLADKLAERRLVHAPREVQFEGIVGTTPRMIEVMDRLRKAAPTDAPIVILGETGTGKELVARAIHAASQRKNGPFVALHLDATPEGLIESELFGHKKGAFTGALADRVGKLEAAHGGTLFLDEVGDIPLETQTKLLRVLETRQFEPVGGNRTVQADFRLISATNQHVEQMIKEKKFREELWYRINVVRIELAPLRERRGDIPLIVERFLREYAERYGKRLDGIEPDALAALRRHAWPGNIRELRNIVHNMVVLADGNRLTLRDVPREVRGGDPQDAPALTVGAGPAPAAGGTAALAGRPMDDIERDAIRETLKLTDGNRKAAADLLQIGERTLYRKIEKYGL
jgi:two-component system, NtrC family, response regulator HydG